MTMPHLASKEMLSLMWYSEKEECVLEQTDKYPLSGNI